MESNSIFFDSGRRWKKIKILCFLMLFLMEAALLTLLYAYYYSPFKVNPAVATEKTYQEVEEINNESRPVVNQGTFLTIEEIFGKTYIKRSGEEKKTVILTFDDGPDPRFTPEVLRVLEKERVKGTFFVVGSQIYKYPKIGHAILAQGSDMGLHTFSHAENKEDNQLNSFTFLKEMDFTEKLFAHHYGFKTKLFRIPYLGLEDKLSYNSLQYVREAHNRGFTISAPTVDAEDWNVAYDAEKITQLATTINVQTAVILFHDAGGDRSATIKALPGIIKFYRDRGYTFTTVTELAKEYGLPHKEPLTLADKTFSFLTFHMYNIYRQSPLLLTEGFIIGFFIVIVHMGIFLSMALVQKMRSRKNHAGKKTQFHSLVSIVIPMYNEERVIKPTIRAVLHSSYKHFELIIVDDGSNDRSAERAEQMKFDPRVQVLKKENGGKFSALNYGLKHAHGKVIVFIDADTRVKSSALRRILEYFSDKRTAAVAGNIYVGNKRNFLTKLQGIEYTLNQNIEKRVYELFGCVPIVPGAFGAWRTNLIRKAGGFSYTTHAEDFDLTLRLIKKNYKVRFCEDAIAYTESPVSLQQFFKQRFRWNFGNLQVFFKHRDMAFNRQYGIFGLLLFPRSILVQVPGLLFTPLVDIFILTNIFIGEQVLTLFVVTFFFIAFGLFLFYFFSRSGNKITRKEGFILLSLYAIFVIIELIR